MVGDGGGEDFPDEFRLVLHCLDIREKEATADARIFQARGVQRTLVDCYVYEAGSKDGKNDHCQRGPGEITAQKEETEREQRQKVADFMG